MALHVRKSKLVATAATNNPSLIILREMGYDLEIVRSIVPNQIDVLHYCASSHNAEFMASSGPELLGLIALWNKFGKNWNQQSPDIFSEIISVEVNE